MKIQMIPLSQLVPSSDNVRKTGVNEGIESLAANIKAIGLLQNLQVRQTDKGKYEVLARAVTPPSGFSSSRRPSTRTRKSPATSSTHTMEKKSASPKTSCAWRCILPISSRPSRRLLTRATDRRTSPPGSESRRRSCASASSSLA